jgi:hypothetical protein
MKHRRFVLLHAKLCAAKRGRRERRDGLLDRLRAATSKLSVASAATLFNWIGAGAQAKLNKAAAASMASFLFSPGGPSCEPMPDLLKEQGFTGAPWSACSSARRHGSDRGNLCRMSKRMMGTFPQG